MDTEADYTGVEGRPFAVADSVYCCWDRDHRARTIEFLNGLDAEHFATVAAMLAEHLDGDDALAASVALRVTYHQGVETLMSLLGAAAQGPSVVPAWIAKCSTQHLRTVTERLRRGEALLTEVGQQHISFDDLATRIHQFAWQDESGPDSTAAHFGKLWHKLALELLDPTSRAEYNALKHGARVRPGGFTMSIGLEDTFAVAPPPDRMHSLGGSRFGSSFFVTEKVGSSKAHLRIRRTSVNWLPEPLAQRLMLISISISNIVSALRCELGDDPSTVLFRRPVPADAFNLVWQASPGIASATVGDTIDLSPDDELSQDDLRAVLQGRSHDQRPAGA
jgi:hypothetical protein